MAAPLDIDDDLQRMVLRKGEATPVTDTFPTPLDDIDLSVLGSPAERFERGDQDVRKEYTWVPGFRYQEVRAQVPQSFLDRPRLYHGKRAVALLEAQARIDCVAAHRSPLRRLAP